DGIRDGHVTGVQTCALPIWLRSPLSDPERERDDPRDPLRRPTPRRRARLSGTPRRARRPWLLVGQMGDRDRGRRPAALVAVPLSTAVSIYPAWTSTINRAGLSDEVTR